MNKKLSFVMPVSQKFHKGSIVSFLKFFDQSYLEIFIIITASKLMDEVSDSLKEIEASKKYVVLCED